MDEWTAVRAWLVETAARRATAVREVPGGIAVLHDLYPRAHDHNRLVITRPVTGAALRQAADDLLGAAGLSHRWIGVLDETIARQVAADVEAAGYERSNELVMTFAGDLPALRDVEVSRADLDERVAIGTLGWQVSNPEMPEETTRQLGERMRSMVSAADMEFLVARGADGAANAHVDLYWRDGIAQIEEVETLPDARNQGLASALVAAAVRRAAELGNDTIFLVADADDWPAMFYRKLGFRDLARPVAFTRS